MNGIGKASFRGQLICIGKQQLRRRRREIPICVRRRLRLVMTDCPHVPIYPSSCKEENRARRRCEKGPEYVLGEGLAQQPSEWSKDVLQDLLDPPRRLLRLERGKVELE